jgi:hypothetical protein
MNEKISQIEKRRHFSGDRTVVTYDEIKKWIELWPAIREKVPSNLEAFKELSGRGLRYRDYRTIKSYMEKLLPLVNTKAVSAVIDLIDFCESRMPVKEFIQLIQDKLPPEELSQKLSNLVKVLVKEIPPPGQVLRTISSVLSGGFPFDNTRDFR